VLWITAGVRGAAPSTITVVSKTRLGMPHAGRQFGPHDALRSELPGCNARKLGVAPEQSPFASTRASDTAKLQSAASLKPRL
jgi:hypothetical protein